MSYTGLDFSLLGKLPIVIGKGKFIIAPMLGVTYRMFLSVKETGVDIPTIEDFNSFWIKTGCGFDVFFTERVFLRTGLLIGIRFPTEADKVLLDLLEYLLEDEVPRGSSFRTADAASIDIRLAVGFRF
jgi:hypothetical protein